MHHNGASAVRLNAQSDADNTMAPEAAAAEFAIL